MNLMIHGGCLHAMQQLDACSVDLLVTDPPYGYSFMGKDWDRALPSVEIWKEVLKVLKPGAFGFVMCAPRQDVMSRMILNLENAGFRTDFTSIYWTYASGFPKAGNISKMIDKREGVEREVVGEYQMPDGRKRNWKEWLRNTDTTSYGNVPTKYNEVGRPITAPTTPDAKKFDGAYGGFQPKPAVESILVVMKSITEKTFISQALENGKGITWMNDCRYHMRERTIK